MKHIINAILSEIEELEERAISMKFTVAQAIEELDLSQKTLKDLRLKLQAILETQSGAQ